MQHPHDIARLRRLSSAELERVGRESLREHLLAQAIVAHRKHGALVSGFDAFLRDRQCVRHPLRLAFEFGDMAVHQFAQPDIDWRNAEEDGRVLYVRPLLRHRQDLLRLAVTYMIPLINYGEVIADEHCLLYGAALLGMMEQEFYEKICALADFCGAETRMAESPAFGCAGLPND